ncbi:MAG: carbohydrate kinase family protein [Halobacteriota archaeon]|jgi:ribokinase
MGHSVEVIGFGALNCDTIYQVDDLAPPGRETGVVSVTRQPGGSAANTIVGLARLGVRTGFVGTVGSDREGSLLLDDFKREGVDLHGITKAKGNTGTALIFIDSHGERAIYVLPSVNDTFVTANFDYAKQAKIVHLSSFMSIDQLRMQISFVQQLRGSRVKISFSPGNIYAKLGLNELKPLIERSLVLFLNKEEASALTGSPDVEEVASILDVGAYIVAVTLGDKGSYVVTRSKSLDLPPYKSDITDTVGAGDAFAAGFLYGQLTGKDPRESGLYGNYMASKSIAQLGGRKGLLRDLTELSD